MSDIVVVGGANMDYLIKGESLPGPAETVQGSLFQEAPGGKGANQAVAASRLGARVAFVGRIGADERGRTIRRRLEEERVDTTHLVAHATEPTGVALVMVDAAGEKRIMTAPGANRTLSVADVAGADHVISQARVLLLQLEPPLETVMEAIRIGRSFGARIVLDPAPPVRLAREILDEVDLVRLNAGEARVLTGIEVVDVASARRAARALVDLGVESVCVGAPGGNLVATAVEELWVPHLPVDTIDATGAGDAMSAGFAVGLAEGLPVSAAARLASAASALATTRLGAQDGLPTRAEVVALLERASTADG